MNGIGKFALALSVATLVSAAASGGAYADPPLPGLVNQNFTMYGGANPKASFSSVDPTGWTGGTGLIFIDSQTAPNRASDPTYLQTYGNPVGSIVGNYVEADGNPTFESGFNYTVTGLTVGQTYTLSFYQGASQQTGFSGATTNQWIVSLGTKGMSISCNTNPCTYSNADPGASVKASTLMNVPSEGTVGWQFVSVNLTADATSDLLSFLAWGDNGNTANLPPMAFLSGVDSPPGLGVPEPSVWAMLIVGFLGVGGIVRRRRAKPFELAQA
jgi:hypothetical protein